jgi:hypothetical protein
VQHELGATEFDPFNNCGDSVLVFGTSLEMDVLRSD